MCFSQGATAFAECLRVRVPPFLVSTQSSLHIFDVICKVKDGYHERLWQCEFEICCLVVCTQHTKHQTAKTESKTAVFKKPN